MSAYCFLTRLSPFSSFSFLETGKPKCFHASHLKLAGAAALSQTLSLSYPSPASLYFYIYISEWGAKHDEAAWANSECSFPLPTALLWWAGKTTLCVWKTYSLTALSVPDNIKAKLTTPWHPQWSQTILYSSQHHSAHPHIREFTW